jgi:hypothetical protein
MVDGIPAPADPTLPIPTTPRASQPELTLAR